MKINYRLVDHIPEKENMEEEILYVSLHFSTVIHLCLCGCGQEVITPINKHGWVLTLRNEALSLHPSVGNFQFPCRSHYWIRDNVVIWL